MARSRVSVYKENRIWDLRKQGYCYNSIAAIVNTSPSAIPIAIRRYRQRPPEHVSPVRRGRWCNYLSDSQIEDIRNRRNRGETLFSIAQSYETTTSSIFSICNHISYKECEDKYQYSFQNRLMRHY